VIFLPLGGAALAACGPLTATATAIKASRQSALLPRVTGRYSRRVGVQVNPPIRLRRTPLMTGRSSARIEPGARSDLSARRQLVRVSEAGRNRAHDAIGGDGARPSDGVFDQRLLSWARAAVDVAVRFHDDRRVDVGVVIERADSALASVSWRRRLPRRPRRRRVRRQAGPARPGCSRSHSRQPNFRSGCRFDVAARRRIAWAIAIPQGRPPAARDAVAYSRLPWAGAIRPTVLLR
jgi:hypothetical protein